MFGFLFKENMSNARSRDMYGDNPRNINLKNSFFIRMFVKNLQTHLKHIEFQQVLKFNAIIWKKTHHNYQHETGFVCITNNYVSFKEAKIKIV